MVRATRCFSYVKDDVGPDHQAVRDAHATPTIRALARHVAEHPDLLTILSELVSLNKVISADAMPLSDRYRRRRGGARANLTADEEELLAYMDIVYATQDEEVLNARRGVILERIVLEFASRQIRNQVTEEVIDNAKQITISGRALPINGYSVDVAACYFENRSTGFWACKLMAKHVLRDELYGLDEIRLAFSVMRKPVMAGICCLQRRATVREQDMAEYRYHPKLSLYTVETLPSLARP